MRILVAEDEQDIARAFKKVLESRGHEVSITRNGENCVAIYSEEAQKAELERKADEALIIFDVVILDYRMPKMDGVQAAKEILALNPQQRIVFASAYINEILADSIKEIRHATVELIQKPFSFNALIDKLEDREIYDELRRMNVNVEAIRSINPTHDQIKSLLEGLRKLEKQRTC